MSKEFIFQFDISGSCSLIINAKDKNEALQKFNNGDYTLGDAEWDVDFPYHFNPNINELMSYCCNKKEIEE